MPVKGLSPHTESIFEKISNLNCIKDSLLQEGVSIDTLISRARKYLRHNLKTREIISMLVCENIREDKKFSELLPKYNVSINEIRQFIIEKIKENEFI